MTMTMATATAAADNGETTAAMITKQSAADEINQKKSRIQVSNTKKPLFFYVNLAKRYLQQHQEIELSALGMAITTVVTITEILKNNGLVKEKSIVTSTVGMKDANKGRTIQKARIEIVLEKSDKFDSVMHPSDNTNNTSATNAAATTNTNNNNNAESNEKKQ
ncbi:uncharacterized protein At2g34160-like [Andrographis paniculata]|uniref:uncharacterized protein At2g34160-like n=1 Tax=Andrographis paniculata TaxID=175694 RepID=UPI0021E75DB2|nr:uncharacterized protein At2g34160-like [Andrographis paniculata]